MPLLNTRGFMPLMKGEWMKGLLPQSSVSADYTVQRIRGI